jgi:uncharacterized glyoxalase superfamily protein PhnB
MDYKLTGLTPMLETHNMEATIQFYTNILGFTLQTYDTEWGWASLKFDTIHIMFSVPNGYRNVPKPIMSGSLYINPDNVELVWNHLKERCLICYPLEDFEYGMREFGVYDNNGYLLQFGQMIAE